MKITDLDLSVRSYNVLLRAGIDTTEKIKEMTDDDLRQIKHLNEKCLKEIREVVDQALEKETAAIDSTDEIEP